MNTVIAWLVTFIVAVAPPTRPQFIPDAKETPAEATARYESIASDIASVVWDQNNTALFSGPNGRAKTASVIMSIMSHESAFRKDVDFGLGNQARGDGGKSWCLMQINVGTGRSWSWNTKLNRPAYPNDPKEDIVQGFTGEEMTKDRKKCILAGYRIMKVSFASSQARGLPVSEWLRVYASGNIDSGSPQSQHRMNLGINWFNSHKPSFTDAEAFNLLANPAPVAVNGGETSMVAATP